MESLSAVRFLADDADDADWRGSHLLARQPIAPRNQNDFGFEVSAFFRVIRVVREKTSALRGSTKTHYK